MGVKMADLFKVGTKNRNGKAVPLLTNFYGELLTANSGRYVPRRDENTAANMEAFRRAAWKKYIESEHVFLDTSAYLNGWRNVGANTNVTIEKAEISDGEYGLKITPGNATSVLVGKTFTADLSGYDGFMYTVDVSNVDALDRFNVVFEAPDSENRFYRVESGNATVLLDVKSIFGKGTLTMRKTSFSTAGTPTWSNVGKIYFAIKAKDGMDLSVTISNVKMVKQKPKNAKLILRIDDGLQSVYNVAMPIFKQYNIPATCFINPGFILPGEHVQHPAYGGNPAMSLEEVEYLHSLGWSICSHTFFHNLYADPTVDASANYPRKYYYQAYADLSATQDWLIDHGFADGAIGHVYGNHYYNGETLAAALDLFPLDFSAHSYSAYYSPLPWGSSLRHISSDTFTQKTGDTYPNIDSLANGKGIGVVMMHRFDGDNIDGSMSAATLEAMLQYIVDRGDIDCITATDLAYATPAALR